MYRLSLQEIAAILKAEVLGQADVLRLSGKNPSGASIDTRTLNRGELFFALQGEHTDGHRFLTAAREKGARGAVVSMIPTDFNCPDFPLLKVRDTAVALRQLASAQRKLFSGPVAAITGSTGKTSTKDMLSFVLQEKGPVLKNSGNYNNQLGLPLTLLALQEEHWAMTLEMGMSGLGEIDALAAIAQPAYGIITNIGHTHQEHLGSQEKIAQAKAELLSHLPVDGGVVLNTEDRELLKPWLSNIRCPVCWVGINSKADIRGTDVEALPGRGSSFTVFDNRGSSERFSLPLPGLHNVKNALAVIGLARMLNFTWEEIKNGLANSRLTSMRMEFQKIPQRGILLINDAYNANPASMSAALDVLAATAENARSIAVLGDMYELGDYTEEGHLLVGKKAKALDISYLITVGALGALIAKGAEEAGMASGKIIACQNKEEALCCLRELLVPGDVVLVKGSRGMRMEDIAAGLLQ